MVKKLDPDENTTFSSLSSHFNIRVFFYDILISSKASFNIHINDSPCNSVIINY